MAHGTDQAIFGLGDENDSYLASNLASVLDIEASEVDVADAGGYLAATDVEAALAEIVARTPITVGQGTDLIIDTTVGVGTDLRATSLVAAVKASSKYVVEATLFITATANSGYKVGFTGPTDATMSWTIVSINADNDFDWDGEQAITDSHGATAALTFAKVELVGTLVVSTTAGDLTVVAAQNADHADDTVIHLESFLRATKVA